MQVKQIHQNQSFCKRCTLTLSATHSKFLFTICMASGVTSFRSRYTFTENTIWNDSHTHIDYITGWLILSKQHDHSRRTSALSELIPNSQWLWVLLRLRSSVIISMPDMYRCLAIYLFVFLLAAIPSRPEPPRVVVNHISQHNFFSGHVHTKFNLKLKFKGITHLL